MKSLSCLLLRTFERRGDSKKCSSYSFFGKCHNQTIEETSEDNEVQLQEGTIESLWLTIQEDRSIGVYNRAIMSVSIQSIFQEDLHEDTLRAPLLLTNTTAAGLLNSLETEYVILHQVCKHGEDFVINDFLVFLGSKELLLSVHLKCYPQRNAG